MLESWRDGATKSAILDFVARVTDSSVRDYVPPAARIAVFDNDGTLWCEQPVQVQVFFLIDQAKRAVERDPALGQRPAFRALLAHDLAALHALGKPGIGELFAATHAGMSMDEFEATATDWFRTARHPRLNRLFSQCIYQPQVELLEYLRSNGFSTWIVSGGGMDLIRIISEQAYGIPRGQVIGSSAKLRFEFREGRGELMKLPELNSFDDREAKPQNIGLHIGRRPILVFGNSDGDLAMMRYAKTGPGPSLTLLLHHDDAGREMAYDRDFKLSPLTEALDRADEYGTRVVSMKRDWAAVFQENNK